MAAENGEVEWLKPWSAVVDDEMRGKLESELAREVGRGHVLFQRPTRALARRHDQDDVLYAVGSPSQLAVVHLSYAAKPDRPHWPSTTLFDNLMAFIEGRMKPDHDGYAV
jgi:hypothetical protein